MFKIIVMISMGFTLVLSATVSGQMCGDVNNDGQPNLGDVLYYLGWITDINDPPPILWTADVDDRLGYTIADVVQLSDYFFGIPMPTLDCAPNQSYSYQISDADTIFLPTAFVDPEITDQVELPLVTSFTDSVVGMYLAVKNSGQDNSGHFRILSTWYLHGGQTPINISNSGADSSFFASVPIAFSNIADNRTHFSITFDSTGVPGIGFIDVDPVDRSSEWRSCIVKKDRQMYIPVFASMEHTYNKVLVDNAAITRTLPLGIDTAATPVTREITSSHDQIAWAAETDADWIVLNKTFGTTPDQIQISIDKSGLNLGWHRDTITIINADYPRTFPQQIPVSLSVYPVYYAGIDADCDGSFNVGDVVYLIDYLFGDPIGPEPCEPCSPLPDGYPPMDLNCDGKTNITDVVRAMRYLYEQPFGAIPCDRCTQ